MRQVNTHFAGFLCYNAFLHRLKIVSRFHTQLPLPYFHDQMKCLEIYDEIKSAEMMQIILNMKVILIRDFNLITPLQFRELFLRIAYDDHNIESISLPKYNCEVICPFIIEKARKRCKVIWWIYGGKVGEVG